MAMTLCDTMGLTGTKDTGMQVSDVDLVLGGHVQQRQAVRSHFLFL